MHRSRASRRKAGAIPRAAALVFTASFLTDTGWATSDPPCDRYAVHELLPGMSHDRVLSTMGGEGVKTLIRTPGSGETSAVEYPGPTSNVYVQFDRRIDRGGPARAVRVRASMPLLPATAGSLVSQFGPPDAGADDLEEGLDDGAAVWVDEACGVVLIAYRLSTSWWTAGGGTFLQVETLDLARQGGSPASPQLGEILDRKNAPPAGPVPTIPESLPPPLLSVQIAATVSNPSPPPPPEPQAVPPLSPPPVPKPQRASKPPDGPAQRITFLPPVYPATAKWLGVKGRVTLAIALRADGSVAGRPRVVAVHPAGRGFEAAAVNAVRTWGFKPAIRGGRPVASSLRIDVDFE
jgi:TonB family protein